MPHPAAAWTAIGPVARILSMAANEVSDLSHVLTFHMVRYSVHQHLFYS